MRVKNEKAVLEELDQTRHRHDDSDPEGDNPPKFNSKTAPNLIIQSQVQNTPAPVTYDPRPPPLQHPAPAPYSAPPPPPHPAPVYYQTSHYANQPLPVVLSKQYHHHQQAPVQYVQEYIQEPPPAVYKVRKPYPRPPQPLVIYEDDHPEPIEYHSRQYHPHPRDEGYNPSSPPPHYSTRHRGAARTRAERYETLPHNQREVQSANRDAINHFVNVS